MGHNVDPKIELYKSKPTFRSSTHMKTENNHLYLLHNKIVTFNFEAVLIVD